MARRLDNFLIKHGYKINEIQYLGQENGKVKLIDKDGNTVFITLDGVKETIGEKKSEKKEEKSENKIKRPRGWHFMETFVDEEGNVFFKGIEQPELKNTLPKTK
jgi:hypothetical protein